MPDYQLFALKAPKEQANLLDLLGAAMLPDGAVVGVDLKPKPEKIDTYDPLEVVDPAFIEKPRSWGPTSVGKKVFTLPLEGSDAVQNLQANFDPE